MLGVLAIGALTRSPPRPPPRGDLVVLLLAGVLEFAANKPELRHDFDLYLQSRNEDINSL